MIAVGL